MKLYYLPGACSLASHIALIWSSVDYELERLSYEKVHGPDFMALNPKGAVPTLSVSDRRAGGEWALTESLAVLFYIASQNPSARLAARVDDPIENAKMNEMMSELVSEVHKAFVPTFVPDRYVKDVAAQDSVRSAAFTQIEKCFRRLDGYLDGGEWLVLDRRTVADAYVFVMCRWLKKTPTPVDTYPNILWHFKRLSDDHGVARAIAEEEGSDHQAENEHKSH